MRHIRLQIINSREQRGECHNCHEGVGENAVFGEEGDERLDEKNDRADHLGYGFDLSEH